MTEAAPSTRAHTHSGDGTSPRRASTAAMLTVLLAGTFVTQFDFFVVNVAAPSLRSDLGAGATALELIVGGYAFALASGMVTGGRLGDLYGHRRLFTIGMAGFGLASLLCGIAVSPGQLIAARLLQGLTAALMAPQVLATITATFAPAERPRAIAAYGVTAGIGSIAGQLFGGLLLDADIAGLGWRVIFLVNVPVCTLVALCAPRVLPPAHSGRGAGLDPVGAVGLSAALALLLVPLALGHSSSWPVWTWLSMAGGVLFGALTLWWERALGTRGGSPVLDLTLFHGSSFRAGIIASAAFYIYFGSFIFTLTLLLQGGLSLGPVGAGLTFTPMGASYMVSSMVGKRLTARYGMNALIGGSAVIALGLLALLLRVQAAGADTEVAWICGCLCLVGLGNGVVLPSLIGAALLRVPPQKAGMASGALTTAQQFASSAGVAAVGAVFFAVAGDERPGTGYPAAMVAATSVCLAMVLVVMGMMGVFRRIAAQEKTAEA
ncbi:MFS transporter [Streptomyces thermoviolaceus]|uniref:MFS transporter n=2 Tax=Streptomyces TaxID=1883 RepID=A0ABX0YNB7_STRTL|nr:MFS transporter [Streptomyces thermoviolaceus]NJP13578.1 MFS transporter [Streptomyces thermoviolaceus subsp. thermoviolaceus]RSS03535.1 MFS transporter [Streptomyces sp. WAC00469]GGV65947.1 MFS transporter [Streptomyces thermoviolaceus subsp. apingens]GHA75805.1 MFS transporter [Streptomyces thermoviolaceus subsp. thermoviolaceus]